MTPRQENNFLFHVLVTATPMSPPRTREGSLSVDTAPFKGPLESSFHGDLSHI